MDYRSATEARRNIGKLWKEAATHPITVLSHGNPIAVVMSVNEYDKLVSRRRPRVAGTGANLLADVDVAELLSTPIDDIFAEYM